MSIFESLNNLYTKKGYFDKYGGDFYLTIAIFLIVILYVSLSGFENFSKTATKNWNNVKCNPVIIPFAGYINKQEAEKKIREKDDTFKGMSDDEWDNFKDDFNTGDSDQVQFDKILHDVAYFRFYDGTNEDEEEENMTTCYGCDELFDNDDLRGICQREDCKIHQWDDGCSDPRVLCKNCYVNNNPAAEEHLEAKIKKHKRKRKRLVIVDAPPPPPKWHQKCSKCDNIKHDCDWVYCLQNRAYCGDCSPSSSCDLTYCQACH